MSVVHGVNGDRIYTSNNFGLVTVGSNTKGKWMWVLAGGTIAQYDFVSSASAATAGTVVAGTTTTVNALTVLGGIAQVAATSGQYFWMWIGEGGGTGSGIKVNALASAAIGAKLYTTATAGAVDDAATTGLLNGLTLCATNGGSTAAVECYCQGVLVING